MKQSPIVRTTAQKPEHIQQAVYPLGWIHGLLCFQQKKCPRGQKMYGVQQAFIRPPKMLEIIYLHCALQGGHSLKYSS